MYIPCRYGNVPTSVLNMEKWLPCWSTDMLKTHVYRSNGATYYCQPGQLGHSRIRSLQTVSWFCISSTINIYGQLALVHDILYYHEGKRQSKISGIISMKIRMWFYYLLTADTPGAIALPAADLHLAFSRSVVIFTFCFHSSLNFVAVDTRRITHIQSGMLNTAILWYSWYLALFICCQHVLLFHGMTILGSTFLVNSDLIFGFHGFTLDSVNFGRRLNPYSTHEDSCILKSGRSRVKEICGAY